MGYIFEAEIAAIMNTVRARTIGESENIRLREVLRSDIHPAIKAYFKAEVERILQEERALELRSKKLSYSLSEVSSLQHQIDLHRNIKLEKAIQEGNDELAGYYRKEIQRLEEQLREKEIKLLPRSRRIKLKKS